MINLKLRKRDRKETFESDSLSPDMRTKGRVIVYPRNNQKKTEITLWKNTRE
jgi:hypothetical protein